MLSVRMLFPTLVVILLDLVVPRLASAQPFNMPLGSSSFKLGAPIQEVLSAFPAEHWRSPTLELFKRMKIPWPNDVVPSWQVWLATNQFAQPVRATLSFSSATDRRVTLTSARYEWQNATRAEQLRVSASIHDRLAVSLGNSSIAARETGQANQFCGANGHLVVQLFLHQRTTVLDFSYKATPACNDTSNPLQSKSNLALFEVAASADSKGIELAAAPWPSESKGMTSPTAQAQGLARLLGRPPVQNDETSREKSEASKSGNSSTAPDSLPSNRDAAHQLYVSRSKYFRPRFDSVSESLKRNAQQGFQTSIYPEPSARDILDAILAVNDANVDWRKDYVKGSVTVLSDERKIDDFRVLRGKYYIGSREETIEVGFRGGKLNCIGYNNEPVCVNWRWSFRTHDPIDSAASAQIFGSMIESLWRSQGNKASGPCEYIPAPYDPDRDMHGYIYTPGCK